MKKKKYSSPHNLLCVIKEFNSLTVLEIVDYFLSR